MTHTKGEWKAVDDKEALATYIECGELQNLAQISWTVMDGLEREERIANAQLISASPDLLEACKEALNSLRTFRDVPKDEQMFTSHDSNVLESLQQAISKATLNVA